jgi:tRNA dimethylallyltransferase
MINNTSQNSIVYILGPTGIGKTKLSLSIASTFQGEIINSDAFSLYKGADIMTAKASPEEIKKVKHHMLDTLDLGETNYEVNKYKDECLNVLETLYSKDILPVVVGGTNYYVESILFDKGKQAKSKNPSNSLNSTILTKIIDNYDSNNLFNILKKLDHRYAEFLHPNDTRRIKNVVLYTLSNGRLKSEGVASETVTLRNPKSFIVILECVNRDLLFDRIAKRISEMLESGLNEIFSILLHFYKIEKLNFTEGILQAIGYKEFHPLFDYIAKDKFLLSSLCEILQGNEKVNEFIHKSEVLDELFKSCRDKLISNTISYAKYQIKFINNRIVPFLNKDNIIQIRIENFDNFDNYIKEAQRFIDKRLKGEDFVNESFHKNEKFKKWQKYFCEVCNVESNGEHEFAIHNKSNKHKKKRAKTTKLNKLN